MDRSLHTERAGDRVVVAGHIEAPAPQPLGLGIPAAAHGEGWVARVSPQAKVDPAESVTPAKAGVQTRREKTGFRLPAFAGTGFSGMTDRITGMTDETFAPSAHPRES